MRTFVFLAAIFLIPAVARSASFDCKKAQTKTEKLICSDKDLDERDTELGKTYAKLLGALPKKEKEKAKKAQKAWLEAREEDCAKASDVAECLAVQISLRSTELEKMQPESGS